MELKFYGDIWLSATDLAIVKDLFCTETSTKQPSFCKCEPRPGHVGKDSGCKLNISELPIDSENADYDWSLEDFPETVAVPILFGIVFLAGIIG